MEIRSITLSCDPDFPVRRAKAFFSALEQAEFGVPLQTRRVALPPFPDWWQRAQPAAEQAQKVARYWREAGADYVSLGPVRLAHDPAWLEILPQLLGAEEMLFASAEVAAPDQTVDLDRCLGVARVIREASTLIANGFGNLYFSALANCQPGSPFFPVAYHHGGQPRFAFALESADLAVTAFAQADTLEQARHNLVSAIEREAARLTETAERLAAKHDLIFHGLDFSLAPFPQKERSLGQAMEQLGLPALGSPGSLFAAAFITDAIDRARFERCGFSGMMLPVLEDSVLAQRAAEGTITVYDLLTYSAVCGTGLDTIPLPGDTATETLAAILMDVGALATRLNKPLTARLMPLPGRSAGDEVVFDFPYFADSRVMAVGQAGLQGPLSRGGCTTLTGIVERQRQK